MFNCKITNDVEVLNMLNKLHPWIPSSKNIRPTPYDITLKQNYIDKHLEKYKTVKDIVLYEILKIDQNTDINKINNTYLLENKFPYQLPLKEETKHYILWFVSVKMTDSEINNLLFNELSQIYTNFEFIWYKNPKMSLPLEHENIEHIHVFVHIKAPKR